MPRISASACGSAASSVSLNWPLWWVCWPESLVKPLAIVTAAAVALLMAGALGYHLKARDKGAVLLPAAITGLAAIALVLLTIVA